MLSRAAPVLLAALAAGCGKGEAEIPVSAPPSRSRVELALCTRRQIEVDGRPESLLAGDFDGDGAGDLVATAFAPGALHFWSGRRAGLRQPDAAIPVGDYPLAPVVLDEKGSGSDAPVRLVAVASRADRSVRVIDLRTRKVVRSIDLPAAPRAMAAGDVDGDGRSELVLPADGRRLLIVRGAAIEERALSSDLPRCVRVLRGARAVAVGSQDTRAVEILGWPGSEGEAALSGVLALSGIPRDLAEADFDGDGDLELAVAGGERSMWIFGLESAGGARGWTQPPAGAPLELDVGTIPLALLTSDFDADGTEDLLALAHHGVRWSVWSGLRKLPAHLLQQAYAGQTPCSAALADFDADGRLDLATANRDSRAISVFRGLVDGKFATPSSVSVGSFPVSVAALDLDGRGDLEIAAVLAKDAALSVIGSDRLERARIPLGNSPRALACVDLDGDGRTEAAAIVREATSSRILALWLDAAGGVLRRTEAPLGRGGSDLIAFPRRGDRPAALCAVDPDGGEILWLEAEKQPDGEVRLAERARIAVPSGPRAVTAVRVGDAAEPALAVALGGPGPRVGLALLRLEAGGLAESQFFPTLGAHRDVAAGDLDGDGREDLVLLSLETADGAVGWIEPWLQTKSGGQGISFAPGARSRTTARPQSLAVADLDGDGLAEVLCACLESHVVDVWKSETRDPASPFALQRLPGVGAGLGCADVRVADLDGDGRAEILVADSANDEVSIISGFAR